jgi:hypothetical protein
MGAWSLDYYLHLKGINSVPYLLNSWLQETTAVMTLESEGFVGIAPSPRAPDQLMEGG